MAYFKINDTDLSNYTASLNIEYVNNYVSQTNAQGDSKVDFINRKRIIEVEIIPLEEDDFKIVYASIVFNPTIYYRDELTGELTSANCIIDGMRSEYYTIRSDKVMYKKMRLIFNEL